MPSAYIPVLPQAALEKLKAIDYGSIKVPNGNDETLNGNALVPSIPLAHLNDAQHAPKSPNPATLGSRPAQVAIPHAVSTDRQEPGNGAIPLPLPVLPAEIIPPQQEVLKSDQLQVYSSMAKDVMPIEPSSNTLPVPIDNTEVSLLQPDIEFDESQYEAIYGTIKHQYSIIIGPAGSGKTTITREVLRHLEHQTGMIKYSDVIVDRESKEVKYIERTTLSIALCAYTGAAVRQIKKVFPIKYRPNCATIHSLLGFHPEWYEDYDANTGNIVTKMRFVPYYTKMNKLPHNIVIVDEASMCTVSLWNQLFEALKDDARVIMVGDINQLPPVYGKSILGYAMQMWPTYELKTIHRNAGMIIRNANRVLAGNIGLEQESPLNGGNEVFQLYPLPKDPEAAYSHACKVLQVLTRENQFNYKQDLFICPENRREQGREQFNTDLCRFFNKNPQTAIDTGTGRASYAIGDKVMVLKNLKQYGLTNGMIGFIKEITLNSRYDTVRGNVGFQTGSVMKGKTVGIDSLGKIDLSNIRNQKKDDKEYDLDQRQGSHIIHVDFEGGLSYAFQTAADFRMLTHAYAVTCHKAQGSEYPTIIILLHQYSSMLLSREWLYTAITRAQHKVFILYTDQALTSALKNQRIKGNTLEEKIKSFILDKHNKDEVITDNEQPHLPESKLMDQSNPAEQARSVN